MTDTGEAGSPGESRAIADETYDLVWKIPNFPHVQETEERLTAQTIEFQFGKLSTVWSKWKGSLELSVMGVMAVRLRLLESQGKSSELLKCSWYYSKTGQPGSWRNRAKIDGPISLQTNNGFALEANSGFVMRQLSDNWRNSCDSNGNLFIKISMNVMIKNNPAVDNALQNFNTCSATQLKESLAALSTDTTFADVTIVCSDGKELKAHRAILCARNPVFTATLHSEMSERNTGIIQVDDIGEPTMKILLHYFYTGELLPSWSEPENIMEFVYAAGKYQLENVQTLLDNVLGTDQVQVYTMQLLSLATKLSLKTAEARIIEKLVQKASSITSGEEFLKLFCNNVQNDD